MKIGNINQYTRLFQFPTMPYFFNDCLFCNYEPIGAIFLFRDNIWISYLPNESLKKTLEEGVELFSDNKKFKKYKDDFEDYKTSTIKFFKEIINKEKLTTEDVLEILDVSIRLHKYYMKTEFFYTDKAYMESQNNKIIRDNMKSLDYIKNDGRAFLNKLFLEHESYLIRSFSILSKQFDVPLDSLLQYSRKEIKNLFHKQKVDSQVLEVRRQAYVCLGENQIIIGNPAKEIWNSFFSTENDRVKEIKGIIASKGKVTGRVKKMYYGFADFHKTKELIEEMKQGEILVAETTSPELILACKKAAAILTNEGGLMSHAAIVSREMGIPCIVGLGNIDKILKDGDLVEVDADNGIVRIIK